MYVHEVPDTPLRQEILNATVSADFHTPDGTIMRCLTPEIFEDAVNTIIFSIFIRIFRVHESHMIRIRVLRNEVRESDVWVPTAVRQRALVALYQSGRWSDVVSHFQVKLSLLPYSSSTKTTIFMDFFNQTEPSLRNCCRELANEPGFISTTTSVYRAFQ